MTTTKLSGKTPILIAFALVACALEAAAATFTVTNANDSGAGSLRNAINQANANAQADTINFDPAFFNVARTITLTSGEIALSSDGANPGRLVTINGPGATLLTISGNNASRIFLLGPGFNANVTMNGMTLRDGNGLSSLFDSGNGGAIYAVVGANLTLNSMVIRNNVITAVASGGGIYLNFSNIVISDSLITENSAYNSGGIHSGTQDGTFTMRNTIVSNNRAIPGDVGGISISRGTVDIKNCQITGNIADRSIGGMDVYQARMEMSDTVISGNDGTAGGAGGINMENTSVVNLRRVTISGNLNGGMYVRNVGEAVNITDSTISNNSVRDVAGFSGGAGGGLSIAGESSSPTRIINTTISGNSAPDAGGGIYNFSNGLELINSTVVNNSVTNTGGNRGGGGIYDGELQRSGGTSFGFRFKVQNSIIAGNTASPGPDVFSGFDSFGYNIIGNTANSNNSLPAVGDQFNVNPQVGALANNGGTTRTHALLPGSPAINAGSNALAVDQNGTALPYDQRAGGYQRVVNGTVDIGAFEVQNPVIPATFSSVSPARVWDTRFGPGPTGQLGAGQTRNVTVTGIGGVPATGVTAVVLNVTAVNPSAQTFATVWPTGEVRPLAANLNVPPGDVRANLVIVKVGAGGQVSVFNNAGNVDFVADVAGWYGPGAGERYTPVSPSRIWDTRFGPGPTGRIAAGGTRNLTVTGLGGVPATGVTAVVLNLTAVNPSARTFITAWPAGETRPLAANLNVPAGDVRPNLVVVKVGANGQVSFFNNAGDVDLIADVAGYFSSTGSSLNSVSPNRIWDSRFGPGPVGQIGAGGSRNLTVTGVGGVPATGVTAVVLNVTAVNPSAKTFITAWPAGEAQPLAANLNVPPGDVRPNLVVVKVGANGQVSFFNNAGNVDLVADIAGWYGPAGQ